ncbi:hypothetical protein MAR_020529 [Mya arenaria]|uniref:TIR domain-containing protein n=1 Tax=Mya arenaria TaxID=6604 RepID=A0ABY7E5N8_MYAAR|nr:hypothetical protein MAR_020529 [Mya arenaria]
MGNHGGKCEKRETRKPSKEDPRLTSSSCGGDTSILRLTNDDSNRKLDVESVKFQHVIPKNLNEEDLSEKENGKKQYSMENISEEMSSLNMQKECSGHKKISNENVERKKGETSSWCNTDGLLSASKANSQELNTLLELCQCVDAKNEKLLMTLTTITKMIRNNRNLCQNLIQCNIVSKMMSYVDNFGFKNMAKAFENEDTRTAMTKSWPVLKKFFMIIWIACDHNVNFCQYTLASDGFSYFVSNLNCLSSLNYESVDMSLFTVKTVLGILHNISRHLPNSKWRLRNEGLIHILQQYLKSQVPMVRIKTLIVLSYILSEAENELISSEDDNFEFIFEVLSDALKNPEHKSAKYGMNAAEILRGVNNLAINDENKLRMVRNGVLELYEGILVGGDRDEVKVTIATLWSLSFLHYNKVKMKEKMLIMERLREYQFADEEEISHAARGVVWELENEHKSCIGSRLSSSLSADRAPNQAHIMISYQWDSQPVMLHVKDRLREAGYKVWMDVEHMSGSTLEAMALAVEKASVVLICMSQKYKDSPNCRTEAEYVYRLRKDFIPLRLQQEYVPDGWLGILVGTRLYFDVFMDSLLDRQVPRLLRELGDRGRIEHTEEATKTDIEGGCSPATHLSHCKRNPTKNGQLDDTGSSPMAHHFADIDGECLLELKRLQEVAPEGVLALLRGDMCLSPSLLLRLSSHLYKIHH